MAGTTGRGTDLGARTPVRTSERLATETKHAFKTTEFAAWLYVSIVTLGYLVSRGLAKSGSREPYWGGGTNEHRDDDNR